MSFLNCLVLIIVAFYLCVCGVKPYLRVCGEMYAGKIIRKIHGVGK